MTDATKAARKSWSKVAFGDVVQLARERSSNPEADGYEHFIGLEHIDPGELRVRRWGNVADGVTFTNVFKPGQVLFGKRRAYQRKVAVADFEGVCSSDIYVLEPRGEDVLPELLPFICQTDAFFEHAVGTSAGSLSPRTNWSSLASFKFALPPIEEQRRLADVLSAIETARNAIMNLESRHAALGQAQSAYDMTAGYGSVSDVAEKVSKGTTPRHLGRQYVAKGIPFLRGEDLQNAEVNPALVANCIDSSTDELLSRSRLRPGDVLLSIAGTIGRVGIVGGGAPLMNCNQAVAFIRPRNRDHAEFLFYWLQTRTVQQAIQGQTVTGTIPNLSLKALKALPVPRWDVNERNAFVKSCAANSTREELFRKHVRGMREFKHRVLLALVGD
jgi:type I restriction enzyme S subunit